MSARRAIVGLVWAAAAQAALLPGTGPRAADPICEAQIDLAYISGPLFGVDGDVYRVQIAVGSGEISGGALDLLFVPALQFHLDCRAAAVPKCLDDGTVLVYEGNLSTTCGTGRTDFWDLQVTDNTVTLRASSPLEVPAGQECGPCFCAVQFDVRLAGSEEARDDATPDRVEELALILEGTCDNGLPAPARDTFALPICGVCDDGDACTADVCDRGTGACRSSTVSCDDANPCTDDGCDAAVGCFHVPNAGPCEDGNACTDGDACRDGTCQPGTEITCGPISPCAPARCNPTTGLCERAARSPCDDRNACTRDTCSADGSCAHAPVVCDDGDPRTRDGCHHILGCVFRVRPPGPQMNRPRGRPFVPR